MLRSTVLPGTTHRAVIPALEAASGKKYGEDIGVAVNPEFLREGTALHDFRHPPMVLVGHNHAADAASTMALYGRIDAQLVSTSIAVAEMVKYASNAWHALKVCFGNEIGNRWPHDRGDEREGDANHRDRHLHRRVGVDQHQERRQQHH